jgi:hypothetical protein
VTSEMAGSGGAGRATIPRSTDPVPDKTVDVVVGAAGRPAGAGAGDGEGDDGVWQAAMVNSTARRWREVRMQGRM